MLVTQDPRHYRNRAALCFSRAKAARTPEIAARFIEAARELERVAAELEERLVIHAAE